MTGNVWIDLGMLLCAAWVGYMIKAFDQARKVLDTMWRYCAICDKPITKHGKTWMMIDSADHQHVPEPRTIPSKVEHQRRKGEL